MQCFIPVSQLNDTDDDPFTSSCGRTDEDGSLVDEWLNKDKADYVDNLQDLQNVDPDETHHLLGKRACIHDLLRLFQGSNPMI